MENNRTFVKKENSTYQFDTDQNGYPTFTQKNLDFVTAIISYDSNYSSSSVQSDSLAEDNYVSILSREDFFALNKLDQVITSIDKINSTHLSSEGSRVKGGGGKEKTAEAIRRIGGEELRKRLEEGDPVLVHEIASAVPNKYNFSFASKFCAYASQHALKKHNFCIYDKVLQSVLPYYYYIYVDGDGYRNLYKTVRGRADNESIISDHCQDRKNTNGYAQYRQLIDDIISGIEEKCGICIDYEAFDHIVWYYFKGTNSKVQKAMNLLPRK